MDTYGGPDPALDHTPTGDNGVMGNDLTSGDGDYSASITQTYWVTSPIIDCSDYSSVIMKYYHWLGIESSSYDHVYMQVHNGASWVTLFENSGSIIDEQAWIEDNYDLSSYADENPDFRIRFGIGTTDAAWQYCGWNIDDIEIKGYFQGSSIPPDLAYSPSSFTDSLAEDETSMLQLTVSNSGAGNLRFRLTSLTPWLQFDANQHDIAPGTNWIYDISIDAAGLAPGDYSGYINFISNDLDMPSGNIPVNLHIHAPQIYIGQSSIVETLVSGEQSSVPLLINNNGPGQLNFSIDCQIFDNVSGSLSTKSTNGFLKTQAVKSQPAEPVGFHPPVPGKTSKPEPIYPPLANGSGGPDTFGYSWIDSNEPGGPDYAWVDITSIGTPITSLGDDQNSGPYPIGFNFDFYSNTFSSFRFCTNGFISFTSSSNDYSNSPLPAGDGPLNLIAPFWDDLYFPGGGSAYYYSNDNDSLVISWVNVPHFSSGGSYTFQVILLGNGKIIVQYQSMGSPLNSATVGIQDNAGITALQVAYNQAYIHNSLAVMFSAGADWLDVSQASGSIAPFGNGAIDVLFDAADLADGDYSGQMTVSSNDPANPSIDIPVTLSVGLYGAIIRLNLSSISDTVEIGHMDDIDLIISNDGNLDMNFIISDNRTWIGELPASGMIAQSGSDTVVVTLDATSLPQGNYSGILTVASDAINSSSIDIPVAFVVEFIQSGYEYLPGDANMSVGQWPPLVIGGDVTFLVNYFRGISNACLLEGFYCAGDANGDCQVIGSDVTRMVTYFRSLSDITPCPDYSPVWPTSGDLPETAPAGWPNCETPAVSGKIINGSSAK